LASNKIFTLKPLIEKLKAHRVAEMQIVFTNGCFDILHAGHVHYLEAAKSEGDILVIGLNSDASMKAIKGEKRPIVGEKHRADVLAAVAYVDYVVLFDDPDPYQLIQDLMPDVLVKGDDWKESDIIGADIVKSHGGRVVRVPIIKGVSTTQIIERIVQRYG